MVTSYPGVYVQEDTSGVRPIEGVTTSTAAFIGLTEKGPVDRALLVTSFKDFQTKFGRLLRGSWLACSVMQFFGNGGRRLYIARVDDRQKTLPTEIQFQKAFALLDPVKDIRLVAVPGYGTPSMVSCGASYCRKRGDCFFIGDMGPGDITRRRAEVFMDRIAAKSSYAAVYLPWLKIQNPEEASPKVIEVPPSGSVAGVHARIDAKRGVWKAAAGTEAAIHGAIGLSANIAARDQDALNAVGANVIRYSENIGVLILGRI
jgi:phage tail sheath protein FI